MLRYTPQPRDSRWFEWGIWIEPTGNSLVNDRLPLLLQQRDEPFLGSDVAINAVVGVFEVMDDGHLFIKWWN